MMALRPFEPVAATSTLRVQYRGPQSIVGVWQEDGHDTLVAVGSPTIAWLEQYCPDLMRVHGPNALLEHGDFTDADEYLTAVLGVDGRGMSNKRSQDQFLRDPAASVRAGIIEAMCNWSYGGIDGWLIKQGFLPRMMEQKWGAYIEQQPEGMALVLYRSWTGFPIYTCFFDEDRDGIRFTSIEIGSNPDYYTPGAVDFELRRARAVIEDVLLGRSERLWAVIDEEIAQEQRTQA